ncbi:MAG: SpoIID/LytB domain-containing protein [Ignavibacterium sp.]|nr:SpoIID/LytB domain-containing protein [Ignavibacterium sp.]
MNDELIIADDKRSLAKVASGNKLRFQKDSDEVSLTIGNKDFSADRFFLLSDDENEIIKIDGRQFRGRLVISNVDSEIKMVNQIGLEDYVKGVMTKEMPIGKGTENYDALKAFSICARTYAYNKINENKNFFDIYPDTRDQVYGGVEGETNFTNEIVDETAGQILVYENEPAIIFYHSTCGGFTEDVSNVFSKKNISYLSGIKDGDEPYCKISPRFEWTEEYSESTLIERLFNAKLIESKRYRISDINIKSRFNSGRVNELEITLKDNSGKENNILISGNRIRSIIRSADDKSILRSTFFNTDIDNNKNIIISGKGNGHGVGLCQWGAIGQSKKGIDFEEILNHYFPGTKVKSIYD